MQSIGAVFGRTAAVPARPDHDLPHGGETPPEPAGADAYATADAG